jgi:hypothetical protein
VNNFTTYDLDRHLAIKQIGHYLHIKKASADIGDKTEYRRVTDIIDILVTEHGIEALGQAQIESL